VRRARAGDASTTPSTVAADSLKGRGRRLQGQAQRYVSALRWVARDALPRYRGRVALIALCNVLAVACAAGAVGGVMLYARHAESGQPVRLMRWTIDFSAAHAASGAMITQLIICGAIVALLGVLSAVFQYLTDNLILSTARMHQQFCAERAMMIVHDPLCRGWPLLGDETTRETPQHLASRMIGSASKQTALALRDMLRILLPALTFAAAVGFLLWVDLRVTGVVLPIALVYLLPLYLINRQVTRRQKMYRAMSREARGDVGRALRGRLRGEAASAGNQEDAAAPLRTDSYRGALRAFYGRLLADRRTHMLNTSFFVACLVVLLMFFGVQAHERGRPWSDLLFYLLALRFAMTALRQVTTLLAKFSRFFPEYRAYGEFVEGAAAIRTRREAGSPAGVAVLPSILTLRIGREPIWESQRVIKLSRGDWLWVLMPLAAEHIDLETLAARLEHWVDEDVDLATSAAIIARSVNIDGAATTVATAPMIVINDDVLPRRGTDATLRNVPGLVVVASTRPDAALLTIIERGAASAIMVADGGEVLGGGDAAWLKANMSSITAELSRRADDARHRADERGDDVAEDDEDEDVE
jgi:ABC-type multidrug transport system fused ATPase/permease subunit